MVKLTLIDVFGTKVLAYQEINLKEHFAEVNTAYTKYFVLLEYKDKVLSWIYILSSVVLKVPLQSLHEQYKELLEAEKYK